MSNQNDVFKTARNNYENAKKNSDVNSRDLATLKARMDAAAAACPGGKPRTGFLD